MNRLNPWRLGRRLSTGPLEVERRAREGGYISSKSFDLKLSRTIAELEREYGVSYDPDQLIPDDPSLAKAVFEAGLALVEEIGVYVVELERTAAFNKEEIVETLRGVKRELTLGEGSDARVLSAREPGSRRRPFVFGGYAGTPTPEEFKYSALSYAQEPLVDALDHGSLSRVGGLKSRGGRLARPRLR
ncbi:MAG: hypothetical protein DRK00_01350 [Thermoprotei archaeon]|nr:MAG: hypothetical protein DRK00_01350 [Thermoprotei archaeon]